MKPLASTGLPPIQMKPKEGVTKSMYRAPTGKIGWLRTISDEPGVRFDLVIRDALGREKFRKPNCGNEGSKEYGDLVNLPTQMGEELQVEVENVRGDGNIQVFLN